MLPRRIYPLGSAVSHPDPAYRYEQEQLAIACRDYLTAWEAGDQTMIQLLAGIVTGRCAAVYKLSPPAGILDVPAMFRREDAE